MRHSPFIVLLSAVIFINVNALSQPTLLDIDTTRGIDRLIFSGYIQVQFQQAQSKGIANYSGGDFDPQSNNRFMLRRARFRLNYAGYNEMDEREVFFVFQFDGTERGVSIRDFWGRIFDTKWNLFSLTTGMFARPMGFEVTWSSSERETPERGRMSQILMPSERDLGMMLSFEPHYKLGEFGRFRADLGVFNGQGLAGRTDFDSHKDIIGRVAFASFPITEELWLSAALSHLNGGIMQGTDERFVMGKDVAGNNIFIFQKDSSHLFQISPRVYYNIDTQIKYDHRWGRTELRLEYLWGEQPGIRESSASVGTVNITPLYRRNFEGAYITFLQNLFSPTHQLVLKYDFYDPNSKMAGLEIGAAGSNAGPGDVKFSTLGLGYVYYFNSNLRAVLYYEWVENERTSLVSSESDRRDNIFTGRVQFRF